VGFCGDAYHSEGKDGKDSIRHVHGWEARWAEVVKGLRDGKSLACPQEHPRFLYLSIVSTKETTSHIQPKRPRTASMFLLVTFLRTSLIATLT